MKCHVKRAHVMMEAPAQHYSEQFITNSMYAELRLGSSKVAVCMRNLSARSITIPAKMTIGSISTANIVPPMLALEIKTNEDNQENVLMQTKQIEVGRNGETAFKIRLVYFRKFGSRFTERGKRLNS